MYADIVKPNWLPIAYGNDQRFAFAAVTRVNADISADKLPGTEGTPYAWRPPACLLALNPVERWRQRKRVDNPRLANMRVTNDPMDTGQGDKQVLQVFGIHSHLSGRSYSETRRFG